MGRNVRTCAVNERVINVAGAGWPAALTPARQREANIQKWRRLHHHSFDENYARARDLKVQRELAKDFVLEDDEDLPTDHES